jgi:hypothetical protein
MTNQTQPQPSDNDIIEIAHMIDKIFVDVGEKYSVNGIQMASIMLGRLMIFTKHVGVWPTFSQLMQEVGKMQEPEPLVKTEDLQN